MDSSIVACKGFKKLCQTDRLLSFLAFQEAFSNKKAWNCVPLHKVFRKKTHAPILDTTRTFARRFRRIFQIILTLPPWNMDYWHALKQSFAGQTRLMLLENGLKPVFIDTKMDEGSETKSQYVHCRQSDVICSHSVQCWPSISAPVSGFCLPPWPPQSQILSQ